ncbi:hypothetical protein Q8W41_01900 [Vibrio splendidus]|uniref:hypothetical protein n=1 Tax=Vibrio splendidus TaxID=29497 RepID=UPI002735CE80|nr:hypothetical protein [Vibrio splendidus]MDP2588241.1 hypothetical protein [Vibrio splendidus]
MSKDNVDIVLKGLCETVNANVETRIRAVDKIIRGFKRNNVELTVPSVVAALKALGINMSASSLYNKTVRGNPNPYRVLFDAWAQDIENSKRNKVEDAAINDFTIMSDADFSSIGSDLVKFKVQTLYNELKSARHQINTLKKIHDLPVIEDKGSTLLYHKNGSENAPDLLNNSNGDVAMHLETISLFLKGSGKLSFDEDGCLVAKNAVRKGDVLSDLELREALEYVLSETMKV